MTTLNKIILHSNYKVIGLFLGATDIFILTVLFLVNKGVVTHDRHVPFPFIFIIISPLLASVLTTLRHRFDNSAPDSFGYWVKTSFINFLIVTITLTIVGLFITKQKDIFQQLFFYRIYIPIFILIIGLTVSAIATLIFKK